MDSSSEAESAIDQLAALQEIDRRLREKTERVRTLEAALAELQGRVQHQRAAAESARAERDAQEARRRQLESHLDAEGAKMTDRRMRLNRVRNERELLALRHEIEVGKEANQLVEEELLGVLESLDALVAAATAAETELAALEAAAATQIGELQGQIANLAAESLRDRTHRDRVAAALDANLRRKYEQIFERRGGTAVVEVRNGTCQGCHMNLPPQFFNELLRAREVRLCPNCHRILFWRPERLEADEPLR